MKNNKRIPIGRVITTMFFVVVVAVTGMGTNMQNVYAGYSEHVATIKEDADAIDDAMWTIPNDDITVKKGTLVFPADSTSDTRLIMKNAIQKADAAALFQAKCNLNLKSVADGQRFIIALGVDSVESYIEEASSVEIYFEKQNGLQVGVRSYNESGEVKEITEKKNVGSSLGKNVTLNITVSLDMKLNVLVNGTSICNQKSPVDLQGRVMLAQSGGCEVHVSNLSILSYTYDRPENSSYFEDFEKGTLNMEILDSKMGFGAGRSFKSSASIEDYHGNKVFMFKSAGSCYFGTAQEYSNFELTFDMPYLLYKDILREDGTVQTQKQGALVFGIGCPPAANEHFVYEHGAEALVIETGVIYNYKTLPTYRKNFDTSVYGDPENNVGYSVKLRVVDTMLTISLKSRVSGQYDEMISYKVGSATPLGRIYICTGNNLECAIDNWKITNLDENGNVVTTGEIVFTPPTKDWEYEEYDATYYVEPNESEEAAATIPTSWFYAIGITVGSGILFLLVAVVVAVIRKTPKKNKEGEANEI